MVKVNEVGAFLSEVGAHPRCNFRSDAPRHTNLAPTLLEEVGAVKTEQIQHLHHPHHPNQPISMKKENDVIRGAQGARKGLRGMVGEVGEVGALTPSYRTETSRTDPLPPGSRDALLMHALGLGGEAGEFQEIIKKHAFHGAPLDRERAAKELGDILWYLDRAAADLGLTLDEIAVRNVAKLRARYPEGFSAAASAQRRDTAPISPDPDPTLTLPEIAPPGAAQEPA